MSDSEKNVIPNVMFWLNLLPANNNIFIFCAFIKSMFLNQKFYNVSDFEFKKLKRVRFC